MSGEAAAGTTGGVVRQLRELPKDSSNELQHTIVTIHQIACHLLNVGTRKDSVKVSISLHSMAKWSVSVQYEGFLVSETSDTVGEALRSVLGDLAKRLLDRLEGEAEADT